MHIPLVKVFANFAWIVGTALILISFSYHDYLASKEKVRFWTMLRRKSFLRMLMLGMILISAGIAECIRHQLLSTLFWSVAFLLSFWLTKKRFASADFLKIE